jgi:hypothetical protein
MRLAILLALSTALPTFPQTPEWDAFYAKQAEFRKRGDDALKREQARRKAALCANAANGNDMSACLAAESKTTEANYLAYVRSIGALLRLTAPETPRAATTASRLPFDDAESVWQAYREKACAAMSMQWRSTQGDANQSCRLDLTGNHMDELAKLYGDLWH